jgi:hypothetical protein
LFTRAVAAEVGAAEGLSQPRRKVALPLFGDARRPKVRVTSADIRRAIAQTDVEELARRPPGEG